MFSLDVEGILYHLVLEGNLDVGEDGDELDELFFWHGAHAAVGHRFYCVVRIAVEEHVLNADERSFFQVSKTQALTRVKVLVHFADSIACYEHFAECRIELLHDFIFRLVKMNVYSLQDEFDFLIAVHENKYLVQNFFELVDQHLETHRRRDRVQKQFQFDL